MKVSIIIAACNAGPMLKDTIESIHSSIHFSMPYEIIVVDDQSGDGCCEGLTTYPNIGIFRTTERLGCSGARHYAGQRATGDVVITSDPHCYFPENAIEQLALRAIASNNIIQPLVLMEGHSNRSYSVLIENELGLRTRVIARKPEYPILIGSIYVFTRKTWEAIACYDPLPGWWDYDEPYFSTMAYRQGIRIETADDLPRCTHRKYRKTGRLPFSLPEDHRKRNAHWFHAVCLPNSYKSKYKSILDKSQPTDMTADFASNSFKKISEHVAARSTHREGWFLRNVVVR